MDSDRERPIRQSVRREAAQIRLPDGRTFEGRPGTPLDDYLRVALADDQVPVMAAIVNGELRELAYRIRADADVVPVLLSDSDGVRIYRRSLSFLLVAVASELFPEAQVYVDHTFPFGGYFCQVRGRAPLGEDELSRIEVRMREVVEADVPILRDRVPLSEAVRVFRSRGELEKVELVQRRQKETLALYALLGHRDYFHGYMVPSTGYLRTFALQPWPPGFLLQYPRRHLPNQLLPVQDYPQLTTVFRDYGGWLSLLGVESVAGLNAAIASGRIREIVLVSEALHEDCIVQIGEQIAARRGQIRVVLIAGPSASGKTTFSKRLSVQLLARGIRPFPLALDDYFVDREKTPLDGDGNYDFESLQALDVSLFNQHLLALMEEREVQTPHYNFKTGVREEGRRVRLGPDHVIVVEGIHALNPLLVSALPLESLFRVYASALTQLNIDRHNRVPTTDTRLIRRIVRDATYRGYSAEQTLARWESVRRGEKRYIFPYQENADIMFNSALAYELAVLKPMAEPLLLQVRYGSPHYVEAKRLLAFLEWFEACGPELVPDNSILREFVGGSILRDYNP
jgi:uridine kinase